MKQAIYIIKRHEEYGDYLALVLPPGMQATQEEVRPFVEHLEELHQTVKERYGNAARMVRKKDFQATLERRQIHTPEILSLLRTNVEGDLRMYYVYGSPSRPMSGMWVRDIPGAVFLPTDWQRTRYYTYVVTPFLLDEARVTHYNLAFVSGPAVKAKSEQNDEP